MKFRHVIETLYYKPVAMTYTGFLTVHKLLSSRLAETYDPKSLDMADFVVQRQKMVIDNNRIAHISVLGPVARGLSAIEKSCGATGYEDIQAEVKQAVQSGARGIMLHVDSPGGSVNGCPETATLLANAGIPVVACTEGMMASAAYWLSASADYIVASQSASVGSIGVIIPFVDEQALWDMSGIKADPITSGNLKSTFYLPRLTQEQRAYLQDSVDKIGTQFRGWVTSYRDVPADAMQGQVLSGEDMLNANLVDMIGTESDAYQKLLTLLK